MVFSAEDLQHDSLSGSVSEECRDEKSGACQTQNPSQDAWNPNGQRNTDRPDDDPEDRLASLHVSGLCVKKHVRFPGDPAVPSGESIPDYTL